MGWRLQGWLVVRHVVGQAVVACLEQTSHLLAVEVAWLFRSFASWKLLFEPLRFVGQERLHRLGIVVGQQTRLELVPGLVRRIDCYPFGYRSQIGSWNRR
jgi:hypothetical protein